MYMGMGVSGGEEGARNGPSLMPGGDKAAFDLMEPILVKCAAQVLPSLCGRRRLLKVPYVNPRSTMGHAPPTVALWAPATT
jgi:6-phosphogluconate dehydrogenase (decarboxylating)